MINYELLNVGFANGPYGNFNFQTADEVLKQEIDVVQDGFLVSLCLELRESYEIFSAIEQCVLASVPRFTTVKSGALPPLLGNRG
jgi:hypothetical protein